MEDRVCVVTGATSGIGRAIALGLARTGAPVVLVARSREGGERAAAELRAATGNERLEVVTADFESLASVRAAADELTRRHPQIQVLVNSAGAVFHRRRITVDGNEANLAVGYLGAFLLTTLLREALSAGGPARVVNVVGELHRKVRLDLEDLQSERHFGAIEAGSRATLAKVVFTLELARRLDPAVATANCFHPGAIRTRLLRHMPWYLRALAAPVQLFLGSPARGAETGLYLATSPEVAGVTGGYFIRRRAVAPSAEAQDPELGRRLWAASERLTAPAGVAGVAGATEPR